MWHEIVLSLSLGNWMQLKFEERDVNSKKLGNEIMFYLGLNYVLIYYNDK